MKFTLRFTIVSMLILSVVRGQAPFIEEPKRQRDLREATFRYMFHHYNYGPYVKFFCIRSERPLPESFLGRFAEIRPRVYWASDCEITGPMNGVKQKKTGESGMRMSILDIRWINAQNAEVRVEAFSDGIAANWNMLRISLRDGRWVVVSDKSIGVS
jgi:hypothetical protein